MAVNHPKDSYRCLTLEVIRQKNRQKSLRDPQCPPATHQDHGPGESSGGDTEGLRTGALDGNVAMLLWIYKISTEETALRINARDGALGSPQNYFGEAPTCHMLTFGDRLFMEAKLNEVIRAGLWSKKRNVDPHSCSPSTDGRKPR